MDFDVQMAKGASDVAEAAAKCSQPVLEPKYDGWRGVAVISDGRARIYNGRSHKEYTGQIPEIEAELAKLPDGTVVDGEIVAIAHDMETGRFENDFQLVGRVMASDPQGKKYPHATERARVQFVAFDYIRAADDANIGMATQQRRRDALEELLREHGLCRHRVTASLVLEATQENHDSLVEVGFEGSVVKDGAATYGFGLRGHGWFKIKSAVTVDVVVMELPINGKGRNGAKVGHIVFGQYRDGVLVERGHCNPKNDADRQMLTDAPEKHVGRVFELKVYAWSADDNPRHPTFMRWRDDREALSATYRNQ